MMELIEHQRGFNEDTFEAYLDVTVRLPIETLQDYEVLCHHEDVRDELGRQMYSVLQEIKQDYQK